MGRTGEIVYPAKAFTACGNLNEMSLIVLEHLNTWSQVCGTVWEGLV